MPAAEVLLAGSQVCLRLPGAGGAPLLVTPPRSPAQNPDACTPCAQQKMTVLRRPAAHGGHSCLCGETHRQHTGPAMRSCRVRVSTSWSSGGVGAGRWHAHGCLDVWTHLGGRQMQSTSWSQIFMACCCCCCCCFTDGVGVWSLVPLAAPRCCGCFYVVRCAL
jgi:hypothetical protein